MDHQVEEKITKRTAFDWYARFKNENFDLKHGPCSGHPVEFEEGSNGRHLHCYREAFRTIRVFAVLEKRSNQQHGVLLLDGSTRTR